MTGSVVLHNLFLSLAQKLKAKGHEMAVEGISGLTEKSREIVKVEVLVKCPRRNEHIATIRYNAERGLMFDFELLRVSVSP